MDTERKSGGACPQARRPLHSPGNARKKSIQFLAQIHSRIIIAGRSLSRSASIFGSLLAPMMETKAGRSAPGPAQFFGTTVVTPRLCYFLFIETRATSSRNYMPVFCTLTWLGL
jgi:hypothetical protein